ncbi:hypothetical protein [Halobacteriovorax sp. JY17]|uniref:hypothetical protein n=1 Tax=Halobacteriovorax sp. JY17 TaxID=2014617 RepID=UPI000C6AF906|nr:hypothetical protein [Halobacteriovorax sp. JY17]PIK15173.1 MAG: hypothetical protein CES88_00240 [Halobacteriovorax sp. JY17]
MIPRMQIVKENNEIILLGDFFDGGMDLDEVREYFSNWLESYPQANMEETKLFYTSKDGKKEEFKLQ